MPVVPSEAYEQGVPRLYMCPTESNIPYVANGYWKSKRHVLTPYAFACTGKEHPAVGGGKPVYATAYMFHAPPCGTDVPSMPATAMGVAVRFTA
jgi:hypothetical protein